MIFRYLLLLFNFWFLTFNLISQESDRSFYLNTVAGLQGSQIDGDYYSGYNKVGLFAGLYVGRKLHERTDFSFGLAFSQKGARQNPDPENGNYDFYKAQLQYVEVPVQLNHEFKRFTLNWGVYYARLVNAEEENQYGLINNSLIFKSNDFGYVIGFEYKILNNGIIGMRHSYSILPVRDYFFNDNVGYTFFLQKIFNRGLYNNTMMIYFKYQISTKFLKNKSDKN